MLVKIKPKKLFLLTALWLLLVLSVFSSLTGLFTQSGKHKVEAATSSTINFQARLLSSTGALVPDGYYNVQFKLYHVSTSGTADWTETYYDSNGVTAGNDNRVRVVNGYLSVNLGSQTAFPGTINWDQEQWVTLNIGGTTQTATPTWDGEMSPRLQLTAVPYAFKAGQLARYNGSTTSTLDFATQTGARSILLPDESGTLCIQGSTSCGFAAGSGDADYIQNTTSLQASSNFHISGNGTADTSLTTPLLQAPASTALTITGNAASTWSTTAGNLTLQAGSGIVSLGTSTSLISSGALAVTAGAQLTLQSTSSNTVTIDSGTTGAINIGTGANAKTITIGNGSGATSLVLNAGTGAINIGTNAIAHTTTIGNGTGASSVVLNAGTGAVNIGTNAVAHTTTVGSLTGAATTTLQGGTGGVNIGTGGIANTIQIGTTTGAVTQGINIGTNATGSSTSNITIGSTVAGSTTLQNASSIALNAPSIDTNATTLALFNTTATTINFGGAVGAGGINLAGGSGSTGCTVDGLNGNLTCTGTITGSGGTGISSIGTIDSVGKSANGAVISGSSLILQTADGTYPGLVSTGSQTFAGDKTFAGDIQIQGGDITTNQTTANLFATTAATVNIGTAVTNASGGLNLAGGSGSTGCSINGSTGDLACSGNITTTATTGSQGWWSRSGTTLSPVNTSDSLTVGGFTLQNGTVGGGGVTLAPGSGSSPESMELQFGDGTGWKFGFAPKSGANAGIRFLNIVDNGRLEWNDPTTGTADTNLYRSGANQLKTDDNFLIQTSSNSTAALQIQNNAGMSLFRADTTNSNIIVENGALQTQNLDIPTSSPSTISRTSRTSATSGTSYGTGSYTPAGTFSPAASKLLLAYVNFESASGQAISSDASDITISGGSLTWVPVTGKYLVNNGWGVGFRVFYARTTTSAPTNMQVTVDAGSYNINRYHVAVDEMSGVDLVTPIRGAVSASRQSNSNDIFTTNLMRTPESADWKILTGSLDQDGGTHKWDTPSGWTSISSLRPTPDSTVMYRTSSTTTTLDYDLSTSLDYVNADTVYGGFILKAAGGSALNIGANNAGTINIGNSGSSTFISSGTGGVTVQGENSTSAFQVQNASGGSLINVDSQNSNITLLGNNSGELKAWQTASNPLPTAIGTVSVTANGYVYVIGSGVTTIYYAKLNADGSVGTWQTASNALPTTATWATGLVSNGYVYVMGGNIGGTIQSAIYYAKLNTDGSVGTWTTAANSLPDPRQNATSVVSNGYVYVIGGSNSGGPQSTVYYAKLNTDGSVGTWTTAANSLPAVRAEATSIVANGYVYVIGGTNSFGGTAQSTVYYAKLNTDGSVGTWTTAANSLLDPRKEATSVVANGYVYEIGGVNASGSAQSSIYYAKLNNDGTTASWTTAANSLPAARSFAMSIVANGYVYEIGGGTAVYYASTSRVQVGGSLDLVGLQGGNLNDPGAGGSLTAGNTNVIGTLQVQGAASFAQGITVNNQLSVNGNSSLVGDVNVGNRYGDRLFSDNFESGSLDLWDQGVVGSIDTSTAVVHGGKYSVVTNPAGDYGYASATIADNSTAYARAWVYVASQTSGTADLLTLQSKTGDSFTVSRDSGNLKFWDGVTGVTTDSGTALSMGSWHKIELRVTIGASTGVTQVWLDGTQVVNLSSQNNGTSLLGTVKIGDSTSGRTFTTYTDDVVADTTSTGTESSLSVDDSFHVGGTSTFGGNVLIQNTLSVESLMPVTSGTMGTTNLTTIDSTGTVGQYSTVAMGLDGFARISYYDTTNADLKFTQCTNANCTTSNVNTLDSTGTVGQFNYLAIGSDGFARISYYDTTNADLKFIQCTNAACTSKNTNTIDSTGTVGQYSSVVMGADGFARISYYDGTNGDLKYVQCTNAACTTNVITTVDSTGTVGQYSAITVGSDGFARIAYRDNTNGLKMVRCTNAACTTAITPTVLDASTTGATWTSIAMGTDGFVRVGYYDANNTNVKFIQCRNANCTTNEATVVDSADSVGQYTGLAIGTDGFARISYYNATDGDLMLAQCLNASCSTNNITTVDSVGTVGQWSSVAAGSDGYFNIAYYDTTNTDLKFARVGNSFSGSNIGSSSAPFGAIYGTTLNVQGTATFQQSVEINNNLTVNGAIYVNGNTDSSSYSVNGTAGLNLTCSSGNALENATISGGIITGGNCTAASYAKVYNSAAQNINNVTVTTLTFNSELQDTDSYHSTSSNTSRLTAPTSGFYHITGGGSWASNTTGNRYLDILLNGATTIATDRRWNGGWSGDGSVNVDYYLNAGDYVEMRSYQDSGGVLAITANLSIFKVTAAGTGVNNTLQQAYDMGNTVTTTTGRDLQFTLADTTTDANFLVNVASGSTSRFSVQNAGVDVFSVDPNSNSIILGGNLAVYGDAVGANGGTGTGATGDDGGGGGGGIGGGAPTEAGHSGDTGGQAVDVSGLFSVVSGLSYATVGPGTGGGPNPPAGSASAVTSATGFGSGGAGAGWYGGEGSNGLYGGGGGGASGESSIGNRVGGSGGQGVVVLSPTGSTDVVKTSGTSWTVPAGVTRVKVWVIGAGGGGAGANGTNNANSGGGGGAGGVTYKVLSVTPGQTITYSLGTAGTGGTGGSNGSSGGNTTVTVGNFTMTGVGGSGGQFNNNVSGSGGSFSGGDIVSVNNSDLNVSGGNTLLRTATDSASAFQIQKANGTQLLGFDTTGNGALSLAQNVQLKLGTNAAIIENGSTNLVISETSGGTYIQSHIFQVQDNYNGYANEFTLDNGGQATFQNAIDSSSAFQILTAGGSPINLFTADTSGKNIQIGSSTTDTNAVKLILDSYNNATDPSGTNGGMYYNFATSKFRCYQGGTWRDCLSPWVQITKSANQDVTNSATYTTDSDLQFSVTAGTVYTVRFNICYAGSSSSADYKGQFLFPAAIAAKNVIGRYVSTTTADAAQVSAGVLGATTTFPSGGLGFGTAASLTDKRVFEGQFTFQPNSSGTLAYQFAQNTITASQSARTCANSFIEYQAL